MPKQFSRSRRVADLVQKELAGLIQRQITDPRLGMITIASADISPDLKNAKVYVTSLGGEANVEELVETLNDMAGHFRYELAQVLSLRVVPKLKFVFDSSIERGSRLSALIDSLNKDSVEDEGSNEVLD
ncbi:MAG: 30S ribosome-binding factor RbfA [Proteobacteria bacterium]|nr:30S ribosome-binding factor RbfA [Pseudomonadota bacterium]